MKLGLVSDIHSNRVALEAVLDDMPSVDRLLCAGDVVGYNPWPADCLEWVRNEGVPTVQGNHDRAVAHNTGFGFNRMAQAGVEHSRDRLDDGDLEWLADLPTERRFLDDRVKVVHGHPDDPDRYTYPEGFAPSLLAGEDLLVMGHTHVQHHEVFDEGIVCNPGSVGQPRDHDPRAAYAVVDLEAGAVEPRRVEYDIEQVVEAVESAGLPEQIGTRLRDGR